MVVLWLIFLLLVDCSKAKGVEKHRIPHRVTPCGCRHKGVLYDLSKLARSNGSARFTIASAEENNFYSYNPCIPFTIPSNVTLEYHCNNVAICYWSKNGQRRDPLGYQHPGQIDCKLSNEGNVSLVYSQGGQGKLSNYTATIEMICDKEKINPEEATMELKPGQFNSALPVFQVFHQCCCPQGCATCPKRKTETEPSVMMYYEIGTAVAGVVFTVVAGFIGFLIGKKCYHRNGPHGDDRLLPRPGNIGYGAANQPERPDGQDAEGGRGNVDDGRNRRRGSAVPVPVPIPGGSRVNDAGAGGSSGSGAAQDRFYDADSEANVSDLGSDIHRGSSTTEDNHSRRSAVPSEHDDGSY